MRRTALIGLASALCGVALAQERDIGARLVADPRVRAALDWIERNETQTIAEQVRLCEIPAPPFKEKERGEAYRRLFERLGLRHDRVDEVGNVLGARPGRGPAPHLVLAAHLDTVFPEGTAVKTTRRGSVIHGPGIGDDCRGLAVVIAVIRALGAHKVETDGPITFVGNVGEEGLGDLRGTKALFDKTLKGRIDRFISIDGTGLGITNVAVGSLRYRVTFKGPGGHSFGAFGLANPIHALGRAIAYISEIQVPETPKTTFNVGRVGGGTSVNSIAFESWLEMDMRSSDPASLKAVDEKFHRAVDRALAEENARWSGKGALTVSKDLVGNRPAGRAPDDSVAAIRAVSVTRALGFEAPLREGSTDSNVPIHLGVPAVTIGGGGQGHEAHSPSESFDTTESWKGTQRALLVALALASK
jgi:acetylornithine deacetylase/succinyl-diaminopimelate desuccinylase-like protein